jgi:leader peptidase (prepilin peptidase) / N-methyltransferase
MDGIIAVGLALLGWLLGSLVNYLSDVLPVTRSFTPALCANCSKPYLWKDYLLMRPCPECSQMRTMRAWVVQAVLTVFAPALWFLPIGSVAYWLAVPVLVYFAVVMVIDVEHRLILHPVSKVGAVIAFVVGLNLHGWKLTLIGGATGLLIMLALYYFGFVFAKWLGKRRGQEIEEEALGFGDVILSGVLGMLLGFPAITTGLILAILLGGVGSLLVIGYMLLSRKYQAFQAIPYGPFLIIAAVILLYR